ncbi:MAG: hypothetical protein IRZ10_09255 [Thermoflavifilum sp.]|nr:hypothetical protein [Thermoflavifilum sp.]MCL6514597.1 hypothetical protein [Alicyclobacillus sp.]
MSLKGLLISAIGVVLGIVLWVVAYFELPNDVSHRNLAANPPVATSVGNTTGTSTGSAGNSTGQGTSGNTAFYSLGPGQNTLTLNIEGVTTDAGMTFNGYNNGQLKITVPVGWTVQVHFVNKDTNMPHSVGFVPWSQRTGSSFTAAFPGSLMNNFQSGIQATDPAVEFSFKATTAGQYAMVCGIPGHAANGMWDEFDVSSSAKSPTITTPSGTVTVK